MLAILRTRTVTEQVAKGTPLEVMAMIQGEVYEKLRNIAKVQKDLDDDDIQVWKYPRACWGDPSATPHC